MTAELESVYEEPRNYGLIFILSIFVVFAVAAGAWLAGGVAADPAAIVLLLVLSLTGFFIFARAARNDPAGALLFQVLVLAWIIRLIGMGVKLYIFYVVVGESADAAGYHSAGESIATTLASGQFPTMTRFWSTQAVELAAGFLYLVTGPTLIGGWLLFTFLGLLGMLFHYKAFVTAIPQGNQSLYLFLIFFAPTIVMWTNTLGKDASMAFFLGMASYGVARFYRWGVGLGTLWWTALGLGGAFLIRPHIGAIVAVALVAVVVLRPFRAGALTPLIRFATLAACVALAILVVRASASFVSLEDLSVEGVTSFVQEEGESSEQGGLAFSGSFPTTPLSAVMAVATVLFRPYPWESGNLFILASSLEEMFLFGLILYRWRSVFEAIGAARRNAYLALTVVFVVIFIFFFSSVSNFGILIRQRAQVLPFLCVWLAFRGARTGASAQAELPVGTH